MARCIQTCMAQPLQSWPESTIRCRVRTLSPGYPSRAWDTHHLLRRSRRCCCCRSGSHPLCAASVPAQTPATVTVVTEVTPTKKYRVYVEYRECSEHAVLGYLPSGVGIKLVCWLVGVTTVITLTAEEAGTKTETALRLLPLLLLLLLHRRDAADERVLERYECRGAQSAPSVARPLNLLRLSASAAPCAPRCTLLPPPRAILGRRRLGDVQYR